LKKQCHPEFPNIESSHSFVVVTSGGTWVKARGLKDRNPSHSGWFSRLL